MLYLVSTPIGNLGDITLRALQVLKEVDFVVSEDTRKTGHLLSHFEIKKPQISFHAYNEQKVVGRLINLLQDGKSIALVTNAGSPSISDPGYLLVRACIDENIPTTIIPGPSALIAAMILSGLPAHSFTFRGFAPRKPGQRENFLRVDQESPHSLIFYESPFRLVAFLKAALKIFGDRQAAVANDLTKMFEMVQRGRISELEHYFTQNEPRGEYTIVIAGNSARDQKTKA